ncbi:MAG TPA: hypothetical protein PLO43_03015 [Chlamydiales bacterium]|nr:hypothetical protein [Chlamydiales bacterium]HPE85130.1 hypothetical protein [Chlamydiales bacterium]
MTRMSKQGERRNQCPRKSKFPQPKTGSKKDNLPKGFREHANALTSQNTFISKEISNV